MDIVINLNKPAGITSQQAVTRVKRLLKAKKAGHTGTLDPLAEGVLLVCLGEATKISRFLLEMDKRYAARIKLGERTDTYDSEGRIIETKDISFLSEGMITDAVLGFRGVIHQTPPMYSAIKMGGRPLYELARKGVEVEREPRKAEIFDIAIDSINLPYIDIHVSCSKGTYIRSLCDDIGIKLGSGAHMAALSREGIGPFSIRDSVRPEDLDVCDLAPNGRSVYSIDGALSGMSEIILGEADYERARHGMKIAIRSEADITDSSPVKMKRPDGALFAVGRVSSGVISIERNLNI